MMKRLFALTLAVLLVCGTMSAQGKKSKTQYTSVFDLLRNIPGVSVSTTNGPSSMPTVVIRGIGTNSSQTQPLFLVDGIQTDNISYLDPNNVDNVEVIKDGTSAFYGLQGANGVIKITTKAAVEAKRLEAEAKKAEKKAKKEAKKAK